MYGGTDTRRIPKQVLNYTGKIHSRSMPFFIVASVSDPKRIQGLKANKLSKASALWLTVDKLNGLFISFQLRS